MCRQSAATPETNGDKLEQEGTQEGGGGRGGGDIRQNMGKQCHNKISRKWRNKTNVRGVLENILQTSQ